MAKEIKKCKYPKETRGSKMARKIRKKANSLTKKERDELLKEGLKIINRIEEAEPPKILLIDIETAPSLGYVWGKWEQNVISFEKDWYILSFSYKWLGEKKIHTRVLPDYKLYKNDLENDQELVKELWQLFDQADIIIGHNSDKFDNKKSNARFVFHGLTPPSPYKSIDTLRIARRYFRFDSNRLDDLAQYLGVGKKKPHAGFKHTWLDCMRGNMKAWETMHIYNEHDIYLLEGIYLKLRAWADIHPNLDSFTKRGNCPTCQSPHITKQGKKVTKTGWREQFKCESCGSWFSGAKHFKE